MKATLSILSIVVFFAATTVSQQKSEWFLKNHPYNNTINPAEQPSTKGFFAIPVMGNHNYSLVSSPFTLNDMMWDNKLTINNETMNRMAAKATNNNLIMLDGNIPAVGLGFSIGKNYFTLTMKTNLESSAEFNKDIFALRYGLKEYWGLGTNRSFDANASININAYTETAISISRQLTDFLSIGVRLKMLNGMVSMKTNKMKLAIDKRPMSIMVSPDINFTSSFKGRIIKDEYGDIEDIEFDDITASSLFNPDNMGWAADFGLSLKPIPALTVGLSVTDLGSLTWGGGVTEYTMNTSFSVSENIVSDPMNPDEADDYWTELKESFNENLKFKETESSYTTKLNTRVNLTARYNLTSNLSIGGLATGIKLPEGWKTSLSAGANITPTRWIEGAVFYTMAYETYDNIGVGLNFNFGPVNLFVATDNILAALNYKETNNLTGRFGMNLMFGRGKSNKVTSEE